VQTDGELEGEECEDEGCGCSCDKPELRLDGEALQSAADGDGGYGCEEDE